ncbi:MAG: hypothetical protein AABZ47_10320 [Planctomycetota bacterium]
MDHGFSLTAALGDAFKEAGREVDLEPLHCAIGLSLMVCGPVGEADVSNWAAYARDAFLVRGARLFGAEIRDVHPPEAARGLERSSEFEQHFDASYRPLIHNALHNGQSVLAWQGWGSDNELAWGRVVGECGDGVGLEGNVHAREGMRRVVMVRPAAQVYVVERIREVERDANDLVMMMADGARAVLENAVGERHGVVAGVAAYDAWMAARATMSKEEWVGESRSLAESLVASHGCAVRVLSECARGLRTDVKSVAESMLKLAEFVVEKLIHWVTQIEKGSDDAWGLCGDLMATLTSVREESLLALEVLRLSACKVRGMSHAG